VVANRRAAQHAGPPPPALAEWLADRQRQAEQHANQARAGAVAERRVAEALRTWATDRDPATGHQHQGAPPAAPTDRERDRQDEQRDREREEDFSDRWRTYRERVDHFRQTYGWTVPQGAAGRRELAAAGP
jgi:hypothetical protein